MSPSSRLPFPGVVRRLFLLAFIVSTSSCGPALHPLPLRPETDPAVLIARMQARQAGLHGLSAVGRAESSTSDGTMRGRVTVLADTTGRLRVDAWTPTDDLVAALAAGPEGFTYFQRGGACLVGDACRSNLGRVLPRGWDLDSVVRGLLGIAPLRPTVGPWLLDFDRRVGAYRLESNVVGGGRQRVWIYDSGAAARYERDEAGKLVLRLDIEEPAQDAGAPARKVRLRTGRGETELAVRYREVESNPEVSPDDWIVECPPGLDIRYLPCEGEP